MPTELRLDVYRYLFEDCLSNGEVSDVAGLYLCCREVQQELEAEIMARVRPLLTAKYEWESTSFKDGIISFKLNHSLNVKTGKIALAISLPIGKSALRSIPNGCNNFGQEIQPSPGRSAQSSLPHGPSSLSFVSEPPLELSFVEYEVQLFYQLFDYIFHTVKASQPLGGTDRLVLDYGHHRATVSRNIFGELWPASCDLRWRFRQLKVPRMVVCGWISRPCARSDQG